MSSDWKSELAAALSTLARVSNDEAARSLMPPTTPVCDWCSNLSFSQAKARKQNPAKLAAEWAASTKWPEFISKAEASGPYLNFHFSPRFWVTLLTRAASSDSSWASGAPQADKVLIEFPSVNPNKPWHVGHLRNALLGDSLARLLAASGITAERMDYIDDLGLQVAQSVWGRAHLPPPTPPAGSQAFAHKFDHVLGWQYVEVNKVATQSEVDVQVRALLVELEGGHSPAALAARGVVEQCVQAQYETAFAFGIYHDVLVFESDIVRTVFKEGLAKILESGAAIREPSGKNAGCVVVKLNGQPGFEGMESADKVLIRSDGTATYTGKDVAFQLWKFGLLSGDFVYQHFVLQPNRQYVYMSAREGIPLPFARASSVINVIGAEQAYPQKVIAAVMRQMGYGAQADNCIHLAYAHVVLPSGRFSGREGTWMAGHGKATDSQGEDPAISPTLGFTADELLEEMRTRAAEKIKGEYSADERARIAHAVAVAAIRFWFLRPTATQQITFDYEQALSFSGDSGPYIQYAYARACRIVEKAAAMGLSPLPPPPDYAFNESEIALLRLMLEWPESIAHASARLQVHPIAERVLMAASAFSGFYTTTPVLADEIGEQRSARLFMVLAARNLMGMGMDILGLPRLERM